MNRTFRFVLIGIAALVVIAVAGVAAVLLTFDPNKYKPDIEAAVARSTGRTLTLNGKIEMQVGLTPTLHVADVAFSNPPGFSRPQMATLGALDLQIALLPLISGQIQIDRLVLIKPDILLETNAAGQPNWTMTPASSGTPAGKPTGSSPSSAGQRKPTQVSVSMLSIRDGQVGLRDDRTGKVTTVAVKTLDAQAASPNAPLHVTMNGSYGGKAFDVVADTGSLTALQTGSNAPWPVKLALSTLGAKIAADGSVGLTTQNYDGTVSGTVPDLAAFAPFVPAVPLPSVHDISFNAKLTGGPGKPPAFSVLTAHAGASDLGAMAPGLTLSALDIKAPSADQPIQLSAQGSRGGVGFALNGTLGTLSALRPDAKPGPFPVDLTVTGAGAAVTVKGTIVNVATKPAVDLGVTAQIPDLAALSGLAGQPLPPVKQVAFKANVTNPNGGIQLKGLSLTSPDADLAGDLALVLAPRPSLTANLTSKNINLDALKVAAKPASAAPGGPASKPAPPGGEVRHDTRIFPDTPIPFDMMRKADADITLAVGTLRADGADTKSLSVHAVLKDARLTVSPLSADLPAGRMSGTITADASKPTPAVHIQLRAPGLALKSLLAMTGEPPMASGNLEVYADLGGEGGSPHAIASTLDGTLGLAVAGGTLDNRAMGSVLGRVLEAVNLLDLVGKGGSSELRCFATRVRANHGIAAIDPLVLSSSLLTMSGSGSANLGAETLDLGLKPQVRAAATTVVVPLKVTGPIRGPSVTVDKLGAAESNIGTIAGAVAGNATPLGIVGGMLGVDKTLGLTSGDMCPSALAAARGQAAPAPAKEQAPSSKPNLGNPGAILKGLFR
ncbi:MAG TPA: AsmA family protein [Rhodopila sp.]|uniref:AsmA family protein n=1 Tax=Rhodopila sp. TaxID=2480087 RepID=UPI002C061F5A|nr:AsmA family protein [Rhodopila sp.]HVY15632.1 AsmA family protein [Rhodopila sp.]